MVSPALSVLGPALSAAAEGYLYSLSPEAQLKRETIQAKRQELPIDLQRSQLELEEAQRKATEPTIQAVGGGRYYVKYPGKDIEFHDLPEHVKPANYLEAALARQGTPEEKPGDKAIIKYYEDKNKKKESFLDEFRRRVWSGDIDINDPWVRKVQEALGIGRPPFFTGPPGAFIGPRNQAIEDALAGRVPFSGGTPSAAPSAGAGVGAGTKEKPNLDRTIQAWTEFYKKLSREEAEADLLQTYAQDPEFQKTKTPSAQTRAKEEAYVRAFGGPGAGATAPSTTTPAPAPPAAPTPAAPTGPVMGGVPGAAPTPAAPVTGPGGMGHLPPSPRQVTQDAQAAETLRLRQEADRRAAVEQQNREKARQQHVNGMVERETRPFRNQLLAIERSEDITKTLLPLINPQTIGVLAASRQYLQRILGQLPPIAANQMQWVRQQAMQEAASGRLSSAPEENPMWLNLFTQYDGRRDIIGFYTSILAYAHAKAQVQGQALRQGDIRRADEVIHAAQTPAAYWTLLTTNMKYLTAEAQRLRTHIKGIEQRIRAGGATEGAEPTIPGNEAPDPNDIMDSKPD